MERPSAHLDCSAGLTFTFAYAASETSAIGIVREFMKFDSLLCEVLNAFNRARIRVNFSYLVWKSMGARQRSHGSSPRDCGLLSCNRGQSQIISLCCFCQSKYFAFEIYRVRDSAPDGSSPRGYVQLFVVVHRLNLSSFLLLSIILRVLQSSCRVA